MKSQNREIDRYNDRIGLNFDRHLGSAADEVSVKLDGKSLNPNIAASRLVVRRLFYFLHT